MSSGAQGGEAPPPSPAALVRQFLAAAMTEWTAEKPRKATTRGGRRVKMFRRALAEHDTGLTPEQCDTLVRALSAATGLEAMIALLDVAGATPQQARDTVAFMADACIEHMIGAKN